MTRGSCDNSIGSARLGSARLGSARLGSAEHSALFSVCQVVSPKNFRNIIARDRDIYALSLALCVSG